MTTTELTEADVVRVLRVIEERLGHVYPYDYNKQKEQAMACLTSRDALATVLETLTREEWNDLAARIDRDIPLGRGGWSSRVDMLFALLTLPPRDLAFAIAEAIWKNKGRGTP
jgi:hypothetical protein